MNGRPVVTLGIAAVALVLIATAYLARYDISGVPGGVMVLDRWTGTVSLCVTQSNPANGAQLGAACRQTFPAFRTVSN